MGEVIQLASRRRQTAPSRSSRSVATLVADLLGRLANGELHCIGMHALPGRGHKVDLDLWNGVLLTFTSEAVKLPPGRIEQALRATAAQLRQQAAEGGIFNEGPFRGRWLEAAQCLTASMPPSNGRVARANAVENAAEALLAFEAAMKLWVAAWDTAEGRQRVGW